MKQAIDTMNIKTPEWGIEEITGYKPETTFWKDFSIAERMDGLNGVQETFNKAFKEWSDKYRYLTELVLVLNWKCWYWYDQGTMIHQCSIRISSIRQENTHWTTSRTMN